MKIFNVPTGKICIDKFDKGELEYLSIGDYGKAANIKADFLGHTKEIAGVPNGKIMPMSEKWVITISSQYSCASNCRFCDVPKVNNGNAINATYCDLKEQVIRAIKLYPEVKSTKRLNIHIARMGEPTWNKNVLRFGFDLRKIVRPYLNRSFVHPVVSTMLPKKNKKLMSFLNSWTIDIKNYHFRGEAGLQFSINSTCDAQRDFMFNGSSLPLSEISEIGRNLIEPVGRKYALNFALDDHYEVDAKKLRSLFDPRKFMVKITPLHMTRACYENKITTTGGYTEYKPYQKAENDLKSVGFDVLVFVPSIDEDLGRITCGNAILSGTKPEVAHTVEYK